jgi:hypothetical protein
MPETNGVTGPLSAEPAVSHSSDAQSEPLAAPLEASTQVEAAALVPDATAEIPKPDLPKPGLSKPEADSHEPKAGAAKAEAPLFPGEVIVMSPPGRAWADNDAASRPEAAERQGLFGKRRLAAMAAVVVLATVAGALGGALATATLIHDGAAVATIATGNHGLEASVARIDADILALKTGLENSAKLGVSQFNKTSDRLDKIERAQAEPAAKLAKLSEAVDKLRATPAPVASPVAGATVTAKDTTGSISPPAPPAPPVAPKTEVGKLPTVEGWVLRDVANGGALIDGRRGIYEVYAGDSIPGLGRIDAIRRQDGRWVVVTSKGLIVAR